MTALPPSADITDSATTEGDAKTWFSNLRSFLAGVVGTAGTQADALTTLGAPLNGTLAKTSAYTVVAADRGKLIAATTGTWSLTLTAAATLGDGFTFAVRNSGSGTITIDPNSSEQIDAAATKVLAPGDTVMVYCDGTQFATVGGGSGVPAGSITDYAGSSAPTGWLLCYGQAVSRTTYATLFTAISTTYGSGDGSTTFNLPDLRGRVTAGVDNMGGSAANRITSGGSGITGTTLGAAGGAQTHTLTVAEMPSHAHSYTAPAGAFTQSGTSLPYVLDSTAGSTTGSQGGGSAHNNTQPTLMLNKIIKT